MAARSRAVGSPADATGPAVSAGPSTGAAAIRGPLAVVGMCSAASRGGSMCATTAPAPSVNTFSRASVQTAVVRVRCTNLPFAGSECAQQPRATSPVVDGPVSGRARATGDNGVNQLLTYGAKHGCGSSHRNPAGAAEQVRGRSPDRPDQT